MQLFAAIWIAFTAPAAGFQDPADMGQDDFVELRRTSCFGTCPVYTVRVYGDGSVTWSGERFVEVGGSDRAAVSSGEARALFQTLIANDYWALGNGFPARTCRISSSDVPSAITTLHIGDLEKRVSSTKGGDLYEVVTSLGLDPAEFVDCNAPDWLDDLENEIDRLADTHRWIHGEPGEELFRTASDDSSQSGPRVNVSVDAGSPKPGVTPLMRAAYTNDLEEVRQLLDAGDDPDARDASGWTALVYAAMAQGPGVGSVLVLIDAGADPNARSSMGQTPLMAASSSPRGEPRAELLIAGGAEPNAQDANGMTALMHAVDIGAENLVGVLVTAGARTDLRDGEGRTVFDRVEQLRIRQHEARVNRPPEIRQTAAEIDVRYDQLLQTLRGGNP